MNGPLGKTSVVAFFLKLLKVTSLLRHPTSIVEVLRQHDHDQFVLNLRQLDTVGMFEVVYS